MISHDLRQLPSSSEVDVYHDGGYFPVLVHPRGEEVVAVLRGGDGHIGIKGHLDVVRSRDGGRTWLAAQVIVDSEVDDRNPAVGVAPDGTLVVAYHEQGSYDARGNYDGTLNRARARVTWSRDGGTTWEPSRELGYEPMVAHSPYGRMITLLDGTMLLPIYGNRAGSPARTRDHAYLLRSRDGGRTWDDPSLIAQGYNETALLLLPNGDLLAALRSDNRGELLAVCRSSDGGDRWGKPIQITTEMEHPADLTLLSNGWVLMVFGIRHDPLGVQALISRNNGHTWDVRRLLIADGLPGPDLGYPSTVRLNDRIVSAYYSAPRREWGEPDSEIGCCARALLYSERELVRAFGDL
jgi:hypothetical protein